MVVTAFSSTQNGTWVRFDSQSCRIWRSFRTFVLEEPYESWLYKDYMCHDTYCSGWQSFVHTMRNGLKLNQPPILWYWCLYVYWYGSNTVYAYMKMGHSKYNKIFKYMVLIQVFPWIQGLLNITYIFLSATVPLNGQSIEDTPIERTQILGSKYILYHECMWCSLSLEDTSLIRTILLVSWLGSDYCFRVRYIQPGRTSEIGHIQTFKF